MRTHHEKAQVGWQNGEQIDDAIKAENVFSWFFDTIDPEHIFNGKEYGKNPFKGVKQIMVNIGQPRNAFQHDYQNTGQDQYQQHHIKSFTGRSINLKNDRVNFFFQRVIRLFHFVPFCCKYKRLILEPRGDATG